MWTENFFAKKSEQFGRTFLLTHSDYFHLLFFKIPSTLDGIFLLKNQESIKSVIYENRIALKFLQGVEGITPRGS